jgi:glutamyl-tRNA reductase
MAVGEDQIVAQIRAAARSAAAAGTSGPALTRLLDAALRVSKRARTHTRIGTMGISLARAGLDLARAGLGELTGRRAVVLGSGSAGALAVRLLAEAGMDRIGVAGRNAPAATRLAATVGGDVLRTDDVPAALGDTDLLVTATSCPVPVVLAEHVRPRHRPLFVLDLGMPPDVEPAVGRLAGVTLVDVEALGRHLADRQLPDEVPRVRAIVAAGVAAYVGGLTDAAAAPVIGAMRAQVAQLAEAELLRLDGRLPGGLSERQRAETAAAVHRILRKFLHGPTVRARELSAEPDGRIYVEALSRLFDPGVSAAVP